MSLCNLAHQNMDYLCTINYLLEIIEIYKFTYKAFLASVGSKFVDATVLKIINIIQCYKGIKA